MTIESLITFTFASVLISLAPGPDNIFVLTQSALYGRKSGVFITLGLCTGLIVHTTAVALGVAAIFQASTLAFNVLKFVGAGYLLYLAWGAFTAKSESLNSGSSTLKSAWALYVRGIVMNVSNPKVSIFFLAFLPQFTQPQNGNLVSQFFLLGTVFIVVALLIFSAIAMLSGSLGGWIKSSPNAQRYLNRISGCVFLGLSLKLATSSAKLS